MSNYANFVNAIFIQNVPFRDRVECLTHILCKTIMTVFSIPADIICCRVRGQNLITCEPFVRVVMIPLEQGREQLSQWEKGGRPDHWASSCGLRLTSGDMYDSPRVNVTIDNITACYISSG